MLGDEAVLCPELVQGEVQQRYVVVRAVIDQTHAQRFKANLVIWELVKITQGSEIQATVPPLSEFL